MKKIMALFITFLMLLGTFALFPQAEEVEAYGTSETDYQSTFTYMYGEAENERSLNLSRPTSSEDEVVNCPTNGNEQFQQAEVGTWESEPVGRNTRVNSGGIFNFTFWAQGDVSDVTFTVDLTLGNNDGGSFQTETKNLVEDTPIKFTATGTVQGGAQISAGNTFSITITYDGSELPGTGGDNHAEIVFGSKDHPANVEMEMCTMFFSHVDHEIRGSEVDENPESIIWDVNLGRSFDEMDMTIIWSSVTGPVEGKVMDLTHTHDGADTAIEMIWHFGDDSAWSGNYQLNVSCVDYNGNSWWITRNFELVVVGSPDIDFILNDINIQGDTAYQGHPVTINASVEAVGDPSLKGLRPTAYLQIYNSSGEMVREDYATISLDTYNVKSFAFYWTPKLVDTYTAKLWIDYLEGEPEGSYKEKNDLDTGEDNNYGELSFEVVKVASSGDDDTEWYEEDEFIFGSLAAVVLLIILVVGFVVFSGKNKKRRRGRDFDDFDDEDDEEIYEF